MMSPKLVLTICLLLTVTGYAFAQSGSAAKPGGSGAADQQSAPAIVIGPGDTLAVTVFDIEALSGTFRVSQKGEVDLPLIGRIPVAGLTANEAASEIQTRLKNGGFVLKPQVTVLVTQYATQGANVMGQVQKPGIYPTLGSRTLLDMLTLAGGVTPSAGKLVTIIHRDDPRNPVYLALADNAKGLKMQANPVIRPGDTIIVQKSGIIYILGAVNRPGGYLINNNEPLTLMQALALAGGSGATSNLRNVRLIRKTASGKEEITFNLRKIYRGKQADIAVNNGDILYIPSSTVKQFIYRGYSGLVSSANVAIFATKY